jgi:hypothetical protein
MGRKVHEFSQSFQIGKIGETLMRDYFESLGFQVYSLNKKEQKEYLYDLRISKGNRIYGVEVKTELKGEQTGNIFYETEVDGKPGWTQKYSDDSKVVIVWVLPISLKAYMLPASKLLEIPYEDYEKREVLNPRYSAIGYKVPLSIVKPLCKEIDLSKFAENLAA